MPHVKRVEIKQKVFFFSLPTSQIIHPGLWGDMMLKQEVWGDGETGCQSRSLLPKRESDQVSP